MEAAEEERSQAEEVEEAVDKTAVLRPRPLRLWTRIAYILNTSRFRNLFEARRRIAAWRKEYNEERPHSALGYLTPREFARRRSGRLRLPPSRHARNKNEFSSSELMTSASCGAD